MFNMIPELIQSVASALPPWALALLGVAIAAVAIPAWMHSVRAKQIRTRLRWVGRSSSDEERAKWAKAAFDLAAGRGRRLVVLAEEAHKLNQHDLYRRAMADLAECGEYPEDHQRLSEKTTKERPRYRHPLEAAVAIERLLDQEMYEEAQLRIAEASEHFPDDEELLQLQRVASERTRQ